MRALLWGVACLAMLTASNAEAAVFRLSTSATDVEAGNSLTLNVNDSGSLFVWVSTPNGQTITGLALDILSSEADVLEATDHIIDNPNSRWRNDGIGAGTLGDLVDDSNAVTFSNGLTTDNESVFTLHSEVQFVATAVGSTDISMQKGAQGIVDQNFAEIDDGEITFGTGSVNVAVPEPSSLGLIGLGAIAGVMRRRRRA